MKTKIFILINLLMAQIQLNAQAPETFIPEVKEYLARAVQNTGTINDERKESLDELAEYISAKKEAGSLAELIFICTHNSRRSHMCQILAAAAAAWYGVDHVVTYSGGTEVTAFNPRAVDALRRAGFKIPEASGMNPVYKVSFTEDMMPLDCFSKIYSDSANPGKNFAAVMTCSDADKNCPFIPGAEERISTPYIDPKEADGTDYEAQRYDERAFQIATEMMYVMQQVQ